jgi:peptide-methionine (S)-S-oxide reductase
MISLSTRHFLLPALLVGFSFVSFAEMIEESKSERAVLGGGCFWCVEAVYQGLPGIKAVVSGYAGGTMPNPTYEAVTSGNTGHAEVVEIEYDPAVITFREIVDFFWKAHDPTTLNRQGADVGTQYRSVIFTNNESQKEIAEASKNAAQPSFKSPIVTEIRPLDQFYVAEAYHQDFYDRNPGHPYNRAVIRPKLEKLR